MITNHTKKVTFEWMLMKNMTISCTIIHFNRKTKSNSTDLETIYELGNEFVIL
jgi:enoyl-CoA hydratase/carnithine racemase